MGGNPYAKLAFWQQALWVLATISLLLVMERQFQNFLGKRAIAYANLPEQSLEQALAQSSADGKPVLANFSALWCVPCRDLSRNVLADSAVRQELVTNFHYARLEYESDTDSAWFERFGVTGFPTLLLIENGSVRRLRTPRDAEEFLIALQ